MNIIDKQLTIRDEATAKPYLDNFYQLLTDEDLGDKKKEELLKPFNEGDELVILPTLGINYEEDLVTYTVEDIMKNYSEGDIAYITFYSSDSDWRFSLEQYLDFRESLEHFLGKRTKMVINEELYYDYGPSKYLVYCQIMILKRENS